MERSSPYAVATHQLGPEENCCLSSPKLAPAGRSWKTERMGHSPGLGARQLACTKNRARIYTDQREFVTNSKASIFMQLEVGADGLVPPAFLVYLYVK